MKNQRIFLAIFIIAVSGCTSSATKQAILDYHKSEAYQQLAFNNATRTARDQMLLNLQQYIQLHPTDTVQIQSAVESTWEARGELETAREQFLLGKSLSQITVGQYLYNAQGPLNAFIGSLASQGEDVANAAAQGNKAAGINSITDLLPTTKPSSSILGDFQNTLKKLTGK